MPYFHRTFQSIRILLAILFGGGSLFVFSAVGHASSALSEEALADLVKPSVVRIAVHVTGRARIPAVKVDIKQQLIGVIPDRFTDVPVDEYLSGSGFIIHPDGYIATNAHVVSLETIKTTLASKSALSAVFENALLMSEEEMNAFLDEADGKGFSHDIIQYVIDHSVFDLHNEIAVLRPGAQETRLSSLLKSGFPAVVVAVNDQFFDDERDVALLKIEEQHLPALSLGQADTLTVGKKVYIYGFPATAELNDKDPSEATFTNGVVSAIKQTEDGNLKVFQTDAKVSQGSSGGPLFNDQGEVLGMITFQTNELSRAAGDNFAFALPIEIVSKQALEARVLPEEGIYGQRFRSALTAFLEKHCDTTSALLAETKETHPAFLTDRIIQPYVDKCRQWQDEGSARDTYWDEFRDGVSTLSSPLLYIIGGSLFSFAVLIAMMFWLLRQLSREEREIDVLENRLAAEEHELRQHEARAERASQSKTTPLEK